MPWTDLTGAPVAPGDYLIDERGYIYEAKETDPTIAKAEVIYTYTVKLSRGAIRRISDQGFLHTHYCVKIHADMLSLSQQERKRYFDSVFKEYRLPQLRLENEERKRTVNARRTARGISVAN